MAGEKTATFAVKVPTETNALATANAVDALRQSITTSQDRVKGLQGNLRLLKGATDEVKAAKDKLKSAIVAEQTAVSSNALALDKLGSSYERVKKKAEEASGGFAAINDNARKLGGPVAEVTGRLEKFGQVLEVAGTEPLLAAAGAVGVFVVALGGLAAGVGYAIGKIGAFTLESGNALRTMGLWREAALGSEESSRHFGNQIEALAGKIPTTREELNRLAVDQSRLLIGARISGQGIVDTFNAVAQEAAAMGDSAGKQIEDLITRMKRVGRLGIGRFELQGTGIERADVAGALAKNLHVSLAKATQDLAFGRVKIDDGAKAIRDTIEKRFAGINTKRMLDFDVITQKTGERLRGLTKGVDLEPILSGLDSLSKMLGSDTVTGQALKANIEGIAKILSSGFSGALPNVKEGFEYLVFYSQKIEIITLAVAVGFKGWITHLDGVKGVVNEIIDSLKSAAKLVGATGALGPLATATTQAISQTKSARKQGGDVAQGFANGIAANDNAVTKATEEMGRKAIQGSADKLKIHSPSLVFKEQGRNTVKGYDSGVDEEISRGDSAIKRLGAMAPNASGGASKSGGSGASVKIGDLVVHLHFAGKGNADEIQRAVSSAEFRAAVTKVFEDALTGAGVPIAEVA